MTEAVVPPAVRLVRDFINTREPQVDEELLATPDRLRDWMRDRELIPGDVASLTPADLHVAIAIREGLRAVLADHTDQPVEPAAAEALNRALAEVPVRLFVSDGGYSLVATRGKPIDHALARLLDAIRQSREDETWARLKVCARDTCRWAFYDSSRNQVRRWCSMAGCGNHIKMKRAYAARKGRQP
jgi:predicted RNA-binding Zn ribbon-like protein